MGDSVPATLVQQILPTAVQEHSWALYLLSACRANCALLCLHPTSSPENILLTQHGAHLYLCGNTFRRPVLAERPAGSRVASLRLLSPHFLLMERLEACYSPRSVHLHVLPLLSDYGALGVEFLLVDSNWHADAPRSQLLPVRTLCNGF